LLDVERCFKAKGCFSDSGVALYDISAVETGDIPRYLLHRTIQLLLLLDGLKDFRQHLSITISILNSITKLVLVKGASLIFD